MVGVAVVALLIPSYRTCLSQIDDSSKAIRHREQEKYLALQLHNMGLPVEYSPGVTAARKQELIANDLERQARLRDQAAYRAEMRRKYERVARYPWLPVTPDPPDPR